MMISRSLVLALLGACVLAGCARGSRHEPPGQDSGGIQLGLDLAGGAAVLSQATYTITGPDGYYRSVVVMLGNAPKLSTFIGGTPPGGGYRLAVTGIATDGVSLCTGVSAPFDVLGGRTTVVSLVLRCEEPEPTGSIQANGSLNYCAAVDALMASSSEAPVGGTLALSSTTHDKDSGPAPLSHSWAASAGTFDDPSAANPIFTCAVEGAATLTLTVSDGDCGDQRSISITCTAGGPAPAPADAGAPPSDAEAPADTAAAPADAASAPEASVAPDPCLRCEASSPWPECASRYNLCVTMPGTAAAGPRTGALRKDLCVEVLSCVHATRCDAGGSLSDCFCGQVDGYTCRVRPEGPCLAAFYAAAEANENAFVIARLRDESFALGLAAALVNKCETQPEPLCGPWCGH